MVVVNDTHQINIEQNLAHPTGGWRAQSPLGQELERLRRR